jgi:hypothetical protein
MTAIIIPFPRKGRAAPIHAPKTVNELAALIAPGRTVHAYSAATGLRLGVATTAMRGMPGSARFGGADVAFVSGPGVNRLLPISGLRFRVEHGAAEGAA